MDLSFKIQIKIMKPAAAVFEAVVNPVHLSGYFTRTATPMRVGGQALWTFPEYEGEEAVDIIEIIPNEKIVLEWNAHEEDGCGGRDTDYKTRVTMLFEPLDENSTLLRIAESGWRETQKALEGSYCNCMGWTHMAMCLKAYIEHGVNLRKDGIF